MMMRPAAAVFSIVAQPARPARPCAYRVSPARLPRFSSPGAGANKARSSGAAAACSAAAASSTSPSKLSGRRQRRLPRGSSFFERLASAPKFCCLVCGGFGAGWRLNFYRGVRMR